MSDNHPKGIPPVSGLELQGSSMPLANPRPAAWSGPVVPVIPLPNPLGRRVSISQLRPSPVAAHRDLFADDFVLRNDYPWSQQSSAADIWQPQSSRDVDDNPFALVHVPRNGRHSQYQPSPAAPTPVNINYGVHQSATHDRAGPARPGSSYHQPRVLGQGFTTAGPSYPPPGLAHPNIAQHSPSPVLRRPSHPSPGHARAAPQGYSQSLVPNSPPPSRSVPRRFWVTNVETDVDPSVLLELLQAYKTVIGPFVTELNTKGHFYVGFEDLDEALQWMEMIQTHSQLEWRVYPMSADAFNDATQMAFPIPADLDDAVIATVYSGPQSPVNLSNVGQYVKPFMELVGYVYSVVVLNPGQGDYPSVVRSYDVEVKYRNLHSALNAIRALNGMRNDSLVLEVMPRMAGGHFATTTKARHDYEVSMRPNGKGSLRRTPKTPAKTPARRGSNPTRRPPLTPRTPFDGRGDREHAIDLTSIAYGTDGRTAVMCRNVPNVMAWREFKAILDLSSAGRYDYVYLRMDFGANMNVGYAFVNFATPADIATFVRARAGRIWPGFERFTEKIAEISYADVQGLGTLVERFRNSPVILNHPDNRPRLFHTSGPKTGGEAFFPMVNNFYTLAVGVYRSQIDAGLHGAVTPTTTRRSGRPRLLPSDNDYPTNN